MAGQLVQSAVATLGRQATIDPVLTFTLPAPITPGNTLILSLYINNWFNRETVAYGSGTAGAPSGGGVTWVQRSAQSDPPYTVSLGFAGAAAPGIWTWVGLGSSGGQVITIPIVAGAFQFQAVAGVLSEFSGVSAVLSQPDATSLTGSYLMAGGGANPNPAPSVASSFDGDLLYAVWYSPTHQATITLTAPGGFVEINKASSNFAPGQNGLEATIAAAWRNQTLHGNYTPTWTNADGNWGWSGLGISLRLVGPGATLAAIDAGSGGDAAMLSGASNIIVPAAVFNVPDRYIFDGTDLSTFAVMQVRTSGGDSHPALRGENPPWAGLPGSQPLEQLPASRIVSLNMYVHGMNPDGTVSGAENLRARLNLDALQAVLARGGNRQLIRVMPDGTGRQAYAKVWSVQEIDGRQLRSLYALKVDFYLADPYFYSNTVAAGPVALDAGVVNFAITHPGSVRGHHVLFDIAGPVTNPRITNVTTGTWVQFTGAVPNQQRLYIDAEHFSAFLAGANVVGAISHDGGVPFMWLNPGVNTFSVTSSAFGGTISAAFSPPFI